MASVSVPSGLLAQASLGSEWAAWLDRLPALAAEVVEEWALVLDGEARHGFAALVLPVRTAGGTPAVLKVGFPHDEGEHEHLALRHWAGAGAVRLLRADPHRFVLLLERLHPEDLTELWDIEACEVVGRLYPRLHLPAIPQLRTLSSYVERWTGQLATLPRDAPIPRRLVEQALSLGRDFAADPATDGTIIHGDLHYENVLAADREPWLAIDPKPMSGDRHYEPAPMLWNRWDEVVASGRVRHSVRRRFHTLVDTAELDEDRARDWVVVREVHNAMWAWRDAGETGLTASGRSWVTAAIAIAKAVQD